MHSLEDLLSYTLTIYSSLAHPWTNMINIPESLQVLRKEKLFTAKLKPEFGVPHVLFFGYIISHTGLSVDMSKIEAVRSWIILK